MTVAQSFKIKNSWKNRYFKKQIVPSLVIGNSQKQEPISLNSRSEPHSMLVLGGTGSGKSRFLYLLVRSILQGKWGKSGMLFMSPSEDVYHWVVQYCSQRPELAKKLVLISPEHFAQDGVVAGYRGIPKNEQDAEYIAHTAVEMIFRVHKQDPFDFPRIQRWSYNVLLPVISSGYTLIDCEQFMIDKKFRSNCLKNITDQRVLEDWTYFDAPKLSKIKKDEILEGVMNRFQPFFVSPPVRAILSAMNSFNMAEAMEKGLIVLCNLNDASPITQEAAAFVGSLLIDDVLRSGRRREVRDPCLIPFRVVIDEFAVFSGASKAIASSLDQLRKYKVFFGALACQTLNQLQRDDENLYYSVMSGCKTKLCFGSVSREDSEIMSKALYSGHLDFKMVKDEVYTTRTRMIPELEELDIEAFTRDVGMRGQISKDRSESTKHSCSTDHGTVSSDSESSEQSDSNETTTGTAKESGTNHQEITSKEQFSSQSEDQGDQTGSETSKSERKSKKEVSGDKQSDQQINEKRHSEGTSTFTSQTREHGTQHSTEDSETSSKRNRQGKAKKSGYQTADDQKTVDITGGQKQSIQGSGSRWSNEDMKSDESSTETTNAHKTTNTQFGKQSKQEGKREDQQDTKTQGTRQSSESYTSQDKTHEQASGSRESKAEFSKTSQQTGNRDGSGTSDTSHRSESTSSSERSMNGTRQTSSHTDQTQQSTKTSDSRETGSSEKQSAELSAGWKKTFTKTKTKYNRPEEVPELSRRTFYSVQELWEMAIGDLMNQETGTATLKIGASAPVKVNISRINPPYFDPERSPQAIEKFKQLVFQNHPQYYNEIRTEGQATDSPATELPKEHERNKDDGLFNI